MNWLLLVISIALALATLLILALLYPLESDTCLHVPGKPKRGRNKELFCRHCSGRITV